MYGPLALPRQNFGPWAPASNSTGSGSASSPGGGLMSLLTKLGTPGGLGIASMGLGLLGSAMSEPSTPQFADQWRADRAKDMYGLSKARYDQAASDYASYRQGATSGGGALATGINNVTASHGNMMRKRGMNPFGAAGAVPFMSQLGGVYDKYNKTHMALGNNLFGRMGMASDRMAGALQNRGDMYMPQQTGFGPAAQQYGAMGAMAGLSEMFA